MRVLLVSHSFPPDGIGGVERFVQTLSARLVQAGDAVSVVTRRMDLSSRTPRLLRERQPDGITVFRLAGGYAGLDRFLDHHERLEQLFEGAILEEGPEVVHINHLKDLSVRFVKIAHRFGVPVVLSLRDFYFACPLVHLKKPSGEICSGPDGGRECASTCFAHEGNGASLRWGVRTMYFRRLLGSVERITCASDYVAHYFVEFGADPTRIRVIPNGVWIEGVDPNTVIHSTPRERGMLRLAFLGTVAAHKGVHVILDALRVASLDSVDLLVLGHAPEYEYNRRLREQAAVIPGLTIRLYGAYELAELPRLLHDVDCVIVPSQVPESYSNVTREALALGIPVIASRLGALSEAVFDGIDGLTFDHDRPGELAAILQRLAEDEALLHRLRRGARSRRMPTMSEHICATRAVYEEAIRDFGRIAACRGDVEELAFLDAALLRLHNEKIDPYHEEGSP